MSVLAGLALLVALVGTGWWPMRMLARSWASWPAPAGWPARASLACALGAAITGLVQLALSACGVPSGALVPAALAVLSMLACVLRPGDGRAAEAASATAPRPRTPTWLVALLLVVGATSLAVAAGTPFRSDGSKFWAPKARELAAFGASESPSLHDRARLGLHRDYPLLVPVLLAPVFALSPPEASSGPKLLLGALNLALLGVLAALLLGEGPRPRVLALLAVFATQPLFVALDARESAAAAGFVDSVDALFLLLLVVCVERLRTGEADGARGRGALLACLAGAALVSTKREGAVEVGCVALAWLVAGPRRATLAALVPGVLVLALPTLLIRAGVVADGSGFQLARLADPATLLARSVPVAAGLLGLLVDVSSFGLLPLLLLLFGCRVTAGRRGRAAPGAGRGFGLVLGACVAGFFVFSYLTTDMAAERHIDTSAHRLLWHWLPAITWLVARRDALADAPAPVLEGRAVA